MKSYVSDAARFCLMQLQRPITIGDVITLQTADILLHDAQFEATGLEFDRQAKKFRLAAWLPAWDQARDTKLCCCLYKRRVPLGRLDLVFNAVTECHIGINEQVIYYEIAGLRYDSINGIIDVMTHYAISVQLTVTRLDGGLRATNEIRDDWGFNRLALRRRPSATRGW